MSIALGIVIVAFIGNILLGLITYLKNSKSYTNILFFFFTCAIASYLLVNYLSLNSGSSVQVIFWARTISSVAFFLNLIFLLLAATFPKAKIEMNRKIFWSAIFSTIILEFFTPTNLIFENITFVKGQTITTPGPLISLFLMHTVLFILGGIYILIRKFRNSNGIEKSQIRMLLLGTLFMFFAIIFTNIILVLLFNTTNFIGLLPIYTLVFVSCISYAIVRHRFLDIGFIVARSVAYILLLISVVATYILVLFFVGLQLFHIPFDTKNIIFYGALEFIAAFTFYPMSRLFQYITDSIFYRGQYDQQKLLKSLSDVMSSTIDLRQLTNQILKIELSQMRVTAGAFILFKKDTKNIDFTDSIGYDQSITFNNEKIFTLLQTRKLLIFEEQEESEIKEIMREYKISVVLPLFVNEENIGIVILGAKSSGDIYSQKDLNVFEILAPQLSLAIQNAHEYEEIKQFNTTLKQEVEKATSGLSHITQDIYVKNLELTEKNKTLSILRKIDEIILSSVTDTQEIGKTVTKLLVDEAEFRIAGIFILNNKKILQRLAIYVTEGTYSINHEKLKKIYNIVKTPIPLQNSILFTALQDKEIKQTTDLHEVLTYDTLVTPEGAREIQESAGIKTSFVYPLIVRDEAIGVMVISLGEADEELSEYKKDLLARLHIVIGIAMDNALLYKQVQDTNEKLKAVDKLKDEFVSLASHELRTPMTAIKSYIWMALDGRAGELNEKLKYYLTRAYMSTNRLINLVNDMLNISRIESGRLTVQMQSVDLVKLAQEVIEEVTPRANEVGVHVMLEQPLSSLPPVLADPDKIKEVFINLIGNSLKFTPRDGSIKITLVQKDNMVETSVIDTGSGIAKEDLPKLFQKFAMIEGSYTATIGVQGTGLGLYICRALVTLHQGTISAESEGKGKGSKFTFTLRVFNEIDQKKLTIAGNGQNVGLVHSQL